MPSFCSFFLKAREGLAQRLFWRGRLNSEPVSIPYVILNKQKGRRGLPRESWRSKPGDMSLAIPGIAQRSFWRLAAG